MACKSQPMLRFLYTLQNFKMRSTIYKISWEEWQMWYTSQTRRLQAPNFLHALATFLSPKALLCVKLVPSSDSPAFLCLYPVTLLLFYVYIQYVSWVLYKQICIRLPSCACFPLQMYTSLQSMHVLAERKVLTALKEGGLLKGDVEEMLDFRVGALFMPHGRVPIFYH